MRSAQICVLPGDGVGPEVVEVACDVLQASAPRAGLRIELVEHPIGCAAIDAHGDPLPAHVRAAACCADAVLLGAVGSRSDLPPGVRRAEAALLELRSALGTWSNLRPIRSWKALRESTPLRPEIIDGCDLLVVRELASGLYYGTPKGIRRNGGSTQAVDTLSYTEEEIARIVHLGFQEARRRGGRLASVDKANVLATSRLWRDVVEQVAAEYPDVELEHVLVDACAMRLVSRPREFDVLVTENTFGDILSDGASPIAGSLGMLPSASLGGTVGLYEPVHGTAPDIAGKDLANPIASILCVAMLLDLSFGAREAAHNIEAAVDRALEGGARTPDIASPDHPTLGTRAMGERVLAELEQGLS